MTLYAQWTRTLESIYTNSDIPKATNNTAPDDAWVNGDGGKAFIAYSGKNSEVLYFYKRLEPSGAKQLSCRKTENFTKIGDDYVLDYILSGKSYGSITCHMTEGKFSSVSYIGAGTDYEVLSGTYSAPPAPTEYTVTFDLNGITGTAPDAQTITSGEKATKPADPTDTVHTFAGWYKTKDATTGSLSDPWDFDNGTVTADMTLYAQWTRTMKDLLGNDFPKSPGQTVSPPENAWTNANGYKAYIYNSDKFFKLDPGNGNGLACLTSNEFTRISDDEYVFKYVNGSTSYGVFTLNIEDSTLVSIEYNGAGTSYVGLSGTYSAPANKLLKSPAPKLLKTSAPAAPETITPAKQQNGTYQFTMPEGNVTVKAEFEEAAPHTHTFADTWSSDANGHWHECTAEGCDIKDYSTCGLEGAAYSKHTGLTDDNTCDICGTVFYRPYDVSYTDSTITLKVNVLDSASEPYTKLDCIRFDAFLRANNSGTAYDANMNFDENDYYKGTEFPIRASGTTQGSCVKNGATYTIVINAATFDKITDFDENNPYVWLILRPCHEDNGMDTDGNVNLEYAKFYDSTVCLGKFNSLEDFKNVKPAESLLTTLIKQHLNNETVDKGGLMGRQGLVENKVVSETVGRTIIGLTQDQLNSIDNKLLVIGCDENGKEIKVEVDCAYTYFYDLQPDGSYQKIEAKNFTSGGKQIVAFVIIDKDQNSEAISGYGYYRLYNGTADTESNLIMDVLYLPKKEK